VRRSSGGRWLLLIFCAGVFGGTLLANLLPARYLPVLSGMTVDIGELLKGFSGRQKEYFVYLLKIRAFPILVLWASLFTGHGAEVFCVATLWYGVCSGAVISGAVLLFGAGGILLFLTMIFPQYLFYGMIFVYLFAKLERNRIGRQGKTVQLSEEVNVLLVITVLFLMGTLLEAYLNPILLRMISMVA